MIASPVRRSLAEDALSRLQKRCVECPPDTPVCPTCPSDETCSLKPQSCDACAAMVCVRVSSIPGQQQAVTTSPPIGGIVGGVLGGVVAIFLITFLVWRFCLRGRRRRDTWHPPEKTYSVGTGQGLQGTRPHSIASTVLTQASNVIQIAYIPGVTVRSAPDTPEVPTVPSSYAGTANSTPHLEQHFFMPSRDSQYSDATSIHSENRISLTPSLANRASVATTMYHTDAIIPPIPAQYAVQRQANVVSLKSGTSTPTNGRASPAPLGQQAQPMNGSQIVARSVMARPVEIRKNNSSGGNGVPTMANLAAATKKETYKARRVNTPSVSDEKEVVLSPSTTLFEESPTSPLAKPRPTYGASETTSASGISAVLPTDGPLGSSSTNENTTTADISAMILNAMKSATQDAAHTQNRPNVSKHDSGPFSDANEIADNRSDNRSL